MELADYQLESHSQVRIFFKDGRQQLVAKDQLNRYLLPADQERIQHAFSLRHSYFKDLPKWVKVAVMGMLAVGLGVGGVKAAPGIQHSLHQVLPIVPDSPQTVSQSAAPAPAPVELTPSAPRAADRLPAAAPQPAPAQPQPISRPSTQLMPTEASIGGVGAGSLVRDVLVPLLPVGPPQPNIGVQSILRTPAQLLQDLGLK